MSGVRLVALEKRFSGSRSTIVALRGLDLDVPARACVALLGPSGCGKTTLLRIVAGLERPDAGRVYFDDRDVTAVPPERRGVGMVFAHDALFPHLGVRENVAYGLVGRGHSARDIESRVRDAARRMRVEDLLDRPARTLSGGQRQRVALARALAPEPSVVLLDEPLSRLDAPLRAELRVELAAVMRDARATAILVTHDQSEAMAVAQSVAVVRDGRVEQCAPPRTLYDAPLNAYVAAFVGSPAMAFVPAAALAGAAFPGAVTLGFRADGVLLCAGSDSGSDVAGVVRAVEDLGADTYAYVDSPLGPLVSRVTGAPPRAGDRVSLRFERTRAHPFDANGVRVPEFARV